MKKAFLILLSSFFLANVFAQEYKTDFKKSAEFYKNASNLSMKVKITAFDTKADLKGSILSSGSMYKSGNKYYSDVMNNELICDGKSLLLIDHQSQKAIYKSQYSQSEVSAGDFSSFDSLLAKRKGITYKGTEDNLIEYSISTPNDIITQTVIYFDKSNMAIKKIEYLYNQNHDEYETGMFKVIIEYSSISTAKPSDDKFNLSGLVEKKGKNYQGKGKIKNYQVSTLNHHENYIKY